MAVVVPVRALQYVVLSDSNAPVATYVLHAAGVMQLVPLNKQPVK